MWDRKLQFLVLSSIAIIFFASVVEAGGKKKIHFDPNPAPMPDFDYPVPPENCAELNFEMRTALRNTANPQALTAATVCWPDSPSTTADPYAYRSTTEESDIIFLDALDCTSIEGTMGVDILIYGSVMKRLGTSGTWIDTGAAGVCRRLDAPPPFTDDNYSLDYCTGLSAEGTITIKGKGGPDAIGTPGGFGIFVCNAPGMNPDPDGYYWGIGSPAGITSPPFEQANLILYGCRGRDWLSGSHNGDFLIGGSGMDYIVGREGDDEISGDWVPYTVYTTIPPELQHESNTEENCGEHDGGRGKDDTIYGDVPSCDTLECNGDDHIFGGAGADTIFGDGGMLAGGGYDLIAGDFGCDVIFGEGLGDTIFAGRYLNMADPHLESDYFDGCWGYPYNRIWGGRYSDTIHGSMGPDLIAGNQRSDVIYGRSGDDNIWGGLGDDDIDGGLGNDWICTGNGDADTFFGGSGNDTVCMPTQTTGGQPDHSLDTDEDDDVFCYLGTTDTLMSSEVYLGDLPDGDNDCCHLGPLAYFPSNLDCNGYEMALNSCDCGNDPLIGGGCIAPLTTGQNCIDGWAE